MSPFQTSINRKSRLLCDQCGVLRRVADVQFDTYGDTIVTLRECDHKRGEILSLREGRISVENLYTIEGRNAFPIVLSEAAREDHI